MSLAAFSGSFRRRQQLLSEATTKTFFESSPASIVFATYEADWLPTTRSRDDSRTDLPILIRDLATGLYAPAVAFERIASASTRSSRISRRRARSSSPAASGLSRGT